MGAADHRLFLVLCIVGILVAAAASFYRPDRVQAQNGSAAGETLAETQSGLAQTYSDLAEVCFARGEYGEAVDAANAAASAAPDQAASVEPLLEKYVGAWFSEQTDELVRLAEEKGSEAAAYGKMQEVCSSLDAWQAPRLDERKAETQVRWARKTVARLNDENLFTAALDILEANKPEGTSDPIWDAPVVRAEKIDETNLEALLDVWLWARLTCPTGLLHRKPIERAGEIPLDARILQCEGHAGSTPAWCVVWILIDARRCEEASGLIARIYAAGPIAPNYQIEAEFARLYAALNCERYEEVIAGADRLLANAAGAEAGAARGAGQLRVVASLYKFMSLVQLKRTAEARGVAEQMVRDWPDNGITATPRSWLARQQNGGNAQ